MPADVFQSKFKMGVLKNSVMPGIKCRRADGQALLVGDFLGRDELRRVARPRGGDGRVINVRECIAQRDARDGRFNGYAFSGFMMWNGLRGHRSRAFYTAFKMRGQPDRCPRK